MAAEETYKLLEFTIVNTFASTQLIDLFSYEFGTVLTSDPGGPFGHVYISGTAMDYNMLIQTISAGTIYDVHKIKFLSANGKILNFSLNNIFTNTFGQLYSTPIRLASSVDVFQTQNVVYMNDRVILNGYNIFSNVAIPAHTSIDMILYFKALDASSVLRTTATAIPKNLNMATLTSKQAI